MQDRLFETLYSEWKEEIGGPLYESQSLYIAVFSSENELLLANKSMMDLFRGEPSESLLNPTIWQLRSINTNQALLYEGFLTVGDQFKSFSSLMAKVFIKKGQILIVGSVDVSLMFEQYDLLHKLNSEISHLQRQLIKEKVMLEKTHEQLNLANANLREVNASKDKFLSIMAHDLKNPFFLLLGFSDLLVEEFNTLENEEILSEIEIIHKTVHKTYNLLEDLLLWSRLQLGAISFVPKKMNVGTVCQDVALSLSEIAENKNIGLNVLVKPNIEVLADENMLKTILRNLITNAIKFSWHDSIVVISAEAEVHMVTVTVSDQGVGMSLEQQVKLWTLSQQSSTIGTDHEEGSGLGLLLCKEFTEKMGGNIRVVSELGKGSEFRFTVPGA